MVCGLKEDVFTVLNDLLAQGKKLDYALFRMAQAELGDYLVFKLRDTNTSKPMASVISRLSVAEQAELCDPDLVEVNFGDSNT